MENLISEGIEDRLNIEPFGGDDDLIVFRDIDHSSVNAHTVGFRVVCESISAGNENVDPSFVYNVYTSEPMESANDSADKIGWLGIRGPYVRYCVMSEWSRQATNYIKVGMSAILDDDFVSSIDIDRLGYLSSGYFDATGSTIEYTTANYPSAAIPYRTVSLNANSAYYITNADLAELDGHYVDNPLIGEGKNEIDFMGKLHDVAEPDMAYMGFWQETDDSIAYLNGQSYNPPKMLYSLLSAGKFYADDVTAASAFPVELEWYDNFYLNGNFGFTVSDFSSGSETDEFNWNTAEGTEYEFVGNAPYLYLLTDKSSYYVIASGCRALSGGSAYYDAFVPSYRFAFDVESSDATMGGEVEYFGLKPVGVKVPDENPETDAIARRINELAKLSHVDLRSVSGVDDIDPAVWPRKTWPVIEEGSAYEINGNKFSFLTKLGFLAESSSLFKSGRLYGFEKDLSSITVDVSIKPGVYKEDGKENLFDLETNSSPAGEIDGSIAGTVGNLFCVSGIDLREVNLTDDEIQYSIWWKKTDDQAESLASVGKYYVNDLIGANFVRVRYENVEDPVIVYSGASGFEINCLDASGNQMTSFGLVYPSGATSTMSFNAVSCVTDHSKFVPDAILQNPDAESYFATAASSISGAAFFFGADGVFDNILVPSAISNAKNPYESDFYQVMDSVWEDYTVEPDVDRSGLPGIGIPEDEMIDIRGSSIATWYLYIDQQSTPADSSISLEILDCRGETADGSWIDYGLVDATGVLYRDGEFFLPNGLTAETNEIDGIDELVSFNLVSVVRLKLRYRLVSTKKNATMRVGGYRVVLGYRVSSSSGLHRDFIVGETMLNPVDANRSLADAHMFVRGRCDAETPTYGVTYGTPANASVLDGECYVVASYENDLRQTAYRKRIPYAIGAWTDNDIEDYGSTVSELVVAGSPYFVGCSWYDEYESAGIRVYRNYGASHRIVAQNEFSVDYGNAKFQLYGKVHWDETNGVYKDYGSSDDPGEDCIIRSADTPNTDNLGIYDIVKSANSTRRVVCVRCSAADDSKNFYVRVGDGNTNAVPAPSAAGDVAEFDLLDSSFETVSGNLVSRVFLSNSDSYVNTIPETYWSFYQFDDGSNEGELVLDWYEMYGRIYVNFKDFEPISVTVGSSVVGPDKVDKKDFYRVDKSKSFTASVTCQMNGTHSDGAGNQIVLREYQGRWGIKFFDSNDEKKWDTGEDSLITSMLSWSSDHNISYTLRSSKAYGIGRVKESTKDGKMVWYGKCPYTYDIMMNGESRPRKTVVVDGDSGAKIPDVEWSPIWCPGIPAAYLVNGVIKDGDNVVVVNGTNASFGEYIKYIVGFPNKTVRVNAEDWSPSHNFNRDTYAGSNDFVVSFKGELAPEWGGSVVDGENYPTAIVIAAVSYDENVVRVVGGARPKYPNPREKIMFAPNDWLVADVINEKFRMIFENLDYLDRSTKYYFAPPTDFIGYFGDYMVGDSRRQGYIMRNRVEIYRSYNKDTSIDDDYSMFKNCESICVDATFSESRTGGEISNNLYCSFGNRILAMPIMGDYTGGENVSTIYPEKVNEFITDVTRMMYSPQTGLLFCLSPNTHRVYMFEKKRYTTTETPYYGEIGGYGGSIAKSKFNHPNDIFISTKTIDGAAVDELWVCDTGNKAIKHYTIRGQWLSTIDVSVIDEDPKSVCVDYLNNVYVLTDHYLIRFDSSGYAIGVTRLRAELSAPMLVRSQYAAGFVYVLYSDHVAKYSVSGEFVGNFAETDVLKYVSLCVSENSDVYIATNKNILHYTDALRLGSIAAMENARAERWEYADVALNSNENIQDIVLNNAFQRMYDNIMMYGMCIFGSITDDQRVYDMSVDSRNELIGSFDKDKIFVGVNELVTVNVLNRVFGRMCDMLDKMISLI